MYIFKTKPDGFRQIRRTMIFRDLPLFLLFVSTLGLIIPFAQSERSINWQLIGIITVIVVVIIVFAFLQAITKRRHMYEEFVLTIDEDGITREQYYADTLTIATQEVSKIYKRSDGSMMIKGITGSEPIIIPPQMEEYEKLEYKLSGIKPFSPIPFLEKYWLLTPLTILSLFAVIILVKDKWLVGISGSILLGLHVYTIYSTYKHKYIIDIPKSRIFTASSIVFIIVRQMYLAFTAG